MYWKVEWMQMCRRESFLTEMFWGAYYYTTDILCKDFTKQEFLIGNAFKNEGGWGGGGITWPKLLKYWLQKRILLVKWPAGLQFQDYFNIFHFGGRWGRHLNSASSKQPTGFPWCRVVRPLRDEDRKKFVPAESHFSLRQTATDLLSF